MQVDMHYYGTYAMARAAGINEETALRIAEAAQFVDDYTETADIETSDGGLVSYWPSGHQMMCDANFDPAGDNGADPHRVWVPFHFIPGGEGTSYEDRMRCRKDSAIVRQLMEKVLARSNEDFAPELVGAFAHVYSDTFSHYGFMGLRNDGNLVDEKSIDLNVSDAGVLDYIKSKADGFLGKIAGTATRGLGHACVADFPDRPYLRWSFTYQKGQPSGLRDNQATFNEACEKLFNFFTRFKTAAPQYAENTDPRSFDDIRSVVEEIIAFEGKKEDRGAKWQSAASENRLFFDGEIPEYEADIIDDELQAVKDKTADETLKARVWHFMRAVEVIRCLILNEILPEHSIIG